MVGEDVEVYKETAEGYHGNRITILSAHIEKKAEMRRLVGAIGGLKEGLVEELEERLDSERFFHLRFSKQTAFLEKYELVKGAAPGGVIDASLKVEAYPGTRERALLALKKWLERG